MDKSRIPVTILTGFLGAGKTTLLNELIKKHASYKFAVIENEFGDIPIDNELVVDVDNGIFELSNGCICCTLNGELAQTLLDLVASEREFDHLIVETTGVAEPDGVAAAFVTDPIIQQHFRLDSTICLVDAHHAEEIIAEREEAKRQVTFADFILINKADEVSKSYLQKLENQLKHINSFADIQSCNYGKIPLNLLELNAYEAHKVAEKIDQSYQLEHHHPPGEECNEHCSHDHHHDHDHEHDDEHVHHHSHDIVTQSFIIEQPLDILKFRHWLNVLLMIQGKHLYRVKGIMQFKYQDHKTIVQSVKKMCVFTAGDAWNEADVKNTKIVFIGKHLRRDILEKQLKNCLA